MNNSLLLTFKIIFVALLMIVTTKSNAQKLPNIQKKSLYLSGVKIDGQAIELKEKFQAYNKATDCFYTLSNDNRNLYLILLVKYTDNVLKVLLGGITLTVNPRKAKRDTAALSITFPLLQGDDRGKITGLFLHAKDSLKQKRATNFLIGDLNANLQQASKLIKVTNVLSVSPANLSIYNEQEIRAASMFDRQLFYTYELSIPLKLLSFPNEGYNTFSYQIKINPPYNSQIVKSGAAPPPPPMEATTASPTHFWAEYTLVKQ